MQFYMCKIKHEEIICKHFKLSFQCNGEVSYWDRNHPLLKGPEGELKVEVYLQEDLT